MRSLVRSLVIAMLVLLGSAPLVLAASNTVTIQGSAFRPTVVTISTGDSVTWTNKDPFAHSVRWETAGPNNSATLGQNDVYHQTFGNPGSYSYVCGIHGSSMAGLVIVEGPPQPTPPRSSAPPTPRPTTPPPATPTPSPSPSPTASESPTPSPTATATAAPSPTGTPSSTPSASPLTAPAAQANTAIGLALVAVGLAILAGAFWWRFGPA